MGFRRGEGLVLCLFLAALLAAVPVASAAPLQAHLVVQPAFAGQFASVLGALHNVFLQGWLRGWFPAAPGPGPAPVPVGDVVWSDYPKEPLDLASPNWVDPKFSFSHSRQGVTKLQIRLLGADGLPVLASDGKPVMQQDFEAVASSVVSFSFTKDDLRQFLDGKYEFAIFDPAANAYLSGRASFELKNARKPRPPVEWLAHPDVLDLARPETLAGKFGVGVNFPVGDAKLTVHAVVDGKTQDGAVKEIMLSANEKEAGEAEFDLPFAVLLTKFWNGEFRPVLERKSAHERFEGPVFRVQGMKDFYWLKPMASLDMEKLDELILEKPEWTVDLGAPDIDRFQLLAVVTKNVPPFRGRFVTSKPGTQTRIAGGLIDFRREADADFQGIGLPKSALEGILFSKGESRAEIALEREDGSRLLPVFVLHVTKGQPPAAEEADLKEVILGVTPRQPTVSFKKTFFVKPGAEKELAFGVQGQKAYSLDLTTADDSLVRFTGKDFASPARVRGQVLSVQARITDAKQGKIEATVTVDYSKRLDALASRASLPEDVFSVTLPFHFTASAAPTSFTVRVVRNAPGVVLFSSALSEDAKGMARELARREGWTPMERPEDEFSSRGGLSAVRSALVAENARDSAHPLEYLLIVGNDSTIPIIAPAGVIPVDSVKQEMRTHTGEQIFKYFRLVLDHFFANLDDSGADELAVGRLPFDEADKIANYMKYYYATGSEAPQAQPSGYNPYEFVVWPDETYKDKYEQAVTIGGLKSSFEFSGFDPKLLQLQRFAKPAPGESWPANALPIHVYYDVDWIKPLLEHASVTVFNSHGSECGFAVPEPGQHVESGPSVNQTGACKGYVYTDLPDFPLHSILFCESCLTSQAFGKIALQRGLANFFGCYESCTGSGSSTIVSSAPEGYPFGKLARDYLNALEQTTYSAAAHYLRPSKELAGPYRFDAEAFAESKKSGLATQWILYGNPRTPLPPQSFSAERPRYSLSGNTLTVWLPRADLGKVFVREKLEFAEEAASLRAGYYALGTQASPKGSEGSRFWLPYLTPSGKPGDLMDWCQYPVLDRTSLFVKTSPARLQDFVSQASEALAGQGNKSLEKVVVHSLPELVAATRKNLPPTWANGQPIEKDAMVLPVSRACKTDVQLAFAYANGVLSLYNGASELSVQNADRQPLDLSTFKGVKQAFAYTQAANGQSTRTPFLQAVGSLSRWRGFIPLEGDDLRGGFGWGAEDIVEMSFPENPDTWPRSVLSVGPSISLAPFLPEELFNLESRAAPGSSIRLEFELEPKPK